MCVYVCVNDTFYFPHVSVLINLWISLCLHQWKPLPIVANDALAGELSLIGWCAWLCVNNSQVGFSNKFSLFYNSPSFSINLLTVLILSQTAVQWEKMGNVLEPSPRCLGGSKR